MKKTLAVLIIAAVWGLSPSVSIGGVILPNPTLVVDGIPVASNQMVFGDDFVTYSSRILAEMQQRRPGDLAVSTYGNFNSELQGAGIGNAGLVIYTAANGASNGGTLDDPLDAVAGMGNQSFNDTWGDGIGANANAAATVADILAVLPTGSTVPVFAFDHNETGQAGDTLDINGFVRIVRGGMTIGQWNFDGLFGNGYNMNAWITSPDEITVDPDSSAPFTVNNNTGSGAYDFWGVAPTMDLSQFLGTDEFHVFMNLRDLDNGGDELVISGSVGFFLNPVPEPTSFAVWGMVFFVGAVGGPRRRKQNAK